jgi:hypothetical protein
VHANPLNYEVIMAVLVCWSVGAPFRWQPLVEGRGARPFVLAGGGQRHEEGERRAPLFPVPAPPAQGEVADGKRTSLGVAVLSHVPKRERERETDD